MNQILSFEKVALRDNKNCWYLELTSGSTISGISGRCPSFFFLHTLKIVYYHLFHVQKLKESSKFLMLI